MQHSLICYQVARRNQFTAGHCFMDTPDLSKSSVKGMLQWLSKDLGVPVKSIVITSLCPLQPDPASPTS